MITLIKIIAKLRSLFIYPFRFKTFEKKSLILAPLSLDGVGNIHIGKHVIVQEQTWLAAVPLTQEEANGDRTCELHIGDESVIGHFNHIYATQSIIIEDHVLTADRVYIADNQHTYTSITKSIIQQPITQLHTVRIGQGSWLGENVCVIGANIGKHCVIGANSVVTKDIPDYSVAVGAPAKVVKQYNATTNQWEKVK